MARGKTALQERRRREAMAKEVAEATNALAEAFRAFLHALVLTNLERVEADEADQHTDAALFTRDGAGRRPLWIAFAFDPIGHS